MQAVASVAERSSAGADRQAALLFDLDGTLVDSVYQHVLAWTAALQEEGIELSVWRIHRRIGMSGGLFVQALSRETGRELSAEEVARLIVLLAKEKHGSEGSNERKGSGGGRGAKGSRRGRGVKGSKAVRGRKRSRGKSRR